MATPIEIIKRKLGSGKPFMPRLITIAVARIAVRSSHSMFASRLISFLGLPSLLVTAGPPCWERDAFAGLVGGDGFPAELDRGIGSLAGGLADRGGRAGTTCFSSFTADMTNLFPYEMLGPSNRSNMRPSSTNSFGLEV